MGIRSLGRLLIALAVAASLSGLGAAVANAHPHHVHHASSWHVYSSHQDDYDYHGVWWDHHAHERAGDFAFAKLRYKRNLRALERAYEDGYYSRSEYKYLKRAEKRRLERARLGLLY